METAQTLPRSAADMLKFGLLVVCSMLALVHAAQVQPRCQKRSLVFYAAKNRKLLASAFWETSVTSPVLCVSYCHAHDNCRSVNYDKENHNCQMYNTTRLGTNFSTVYQYNSLYYDADEDTALLSAPPYGDCASLLEAGFSESGIYTIAPVGYNGQGLEVYCDMLSAGGGWLVIQRRQDGSEDFYRNWDDYRKGFGNLQGEFWLGNDHLRRLTESGVSWKLRVDLEDWNNQSAWAEFGIFKIKGENFTLEVGSYNTNSTAGDSLAYNNGMMFTTKDRDNDQYSGNCGIYCHGAWWFKSCVLSHLNGDYKQGTSPSYIAWNSWQSSDGLKATSMKIQPVSAM